MKNRTAIYCRLSREDEKISTSIKNQQDFLIEYLKKNNFKLFKTYIDDGYSGGNFERPGFKSLIEDIKNNNIDIVLGSDCHNMSTRMPNLHCAQDVIVKKIGENIMDRINSIGHTMLGVDSF